MRLLMGCAGNGVERHREAGQELEVNGKKAGKGEGRCLHCPKHRVSIIRFQTHGPGLNERCLSIKSWFFPIETHWLYLDLRSWPGRGW